MIISQVQRWRPVVSETLRRAAIVEPWLVAPVRELGLTDAQLLDVLLAMIQRESGGDPDTMGDRNCSLGLFQVNVCVGRQFPDLAYYAQNDRGEWVLSPVLEFEWLAVPQVCSDAAVRIFLAELADLDDVELAILGYNGHGAVRKWISGEVPQPSNLYYLDDVLNILGVEYGYFDTLKKKTFSLEPLPRWR